MERELTLKDLLVIVLKHARIILVCAFIMGILLCAFGILRSYSAQTPSSADAIEQYSRDVKRAQNARDHAQLQLDGLQKYMENSLYYSIDPYNKGVCDLLFYVETDYSSQELHKMGNVVAAYKSMYKDTDIINGVSQMLRQDVDQNSIPELIQVADVDSVHASAVSADVEGSILTNNVDSTSTLVRISVANENAETASKIAHYVLEAMGERIRNKVSPHTTEILADYSGYEVDSEMLQRHSETEKDLEAAREALTEKQDVLNELLKNPVRNPDVGISVSTLLKQGIKFGMVGLIVGMAVGCCIALLGSILGGRTESARDLSNRYKIPVLGTLPNANEKRWFSGWIRRLEGEPKVAYETAIRAVAANLALIAEAKSILLAGVGDKATLEKLASALGEKVRVAGNILQDAEAIDTLRDTEGVVLAVEKGKTTIEQIDAQVRSLEVWEKEILGIVMC